MTFSVSNSGGHLGDRTRHMGAEEVKLWESRKKAKDDGSLGASQTIQMCIKRGILVQCY